MNRKILMKPDKLDLIDKIAGLYKSRPFKDLELYVDDCLLFSGEHHFDALVDKYPNGYQKRITIRYKSGHVRVPISNKLFVFETNEFDNQERPRGIITIDKVVASPLKKVTKKELLNDGFESKEDLLWQMTEMEGRYYQDLTPESIVTLYYISDYNPNPSEKDEKKLLDFLKSL